MDYENNLARLEALVEKLLESHNGLKQRKAALETSLREREKEIESLQEAVARLQEEKQVVHRRVDGLLQSIEQWEQSQAEAAAHDSGGEAGDSGGEELDSSAPLLSMNTQT